MIDLENTLGLGIHLSGTDLRFDPTIPAVKPAYRHLLEMEAVLLDHEWYAQAPKDLQLYAMYRDISRPQHAEIFRDIRFDITVIPPGILGRELVKTAGHYHPLAETGLPYPEIYQVAYGTAHYLLQKPTSDCAQIEDAVLVQATAGDVVVIPPGYGHITINPIESLLVMTNLVARAFSSNYAPYKQLKGGVYFEMKNHTFVKNEQYTKIPELRKVAPPSVFSSLQSGIPIYTRFCQNPESLKCLIAPTESMFAGLLD
jgi:glucose-6-phosphate isomerase